jgi:hypothetical protein
MGFGVVDTCADQTRMPLLEGRLRLMEADYLGRTNEREIARVEKQDDHLRADSIETQMAYTIVESARKIEGWRGVAWFQHWIDPIAMRFTAKAY